MAKKKKAKKATRPSIVTIDEHVLDRLYLVIDSRKGADPETSYTARLFSRGRQQIAKKLGEEGVEQLDPFDQVQLGYVLRICRSSRTMSDAGRVLFRVTRQGRKHANDADRLGKYLARFGLDYEGIRSDS